MPFTQDDLNALDRAIASGELTIRQGDRWVTYRSFPELQAARDLVQKEVAATTSTTARPYPRYQQADFSDE